MGLDTIQLVKEIEDTFSIEIPDDEASRLLTVGDLHQYIIDHTNLASNSSICLSAFVFRSVRRAAKSLGVSERLRPRDSTLRMLPESNRRAFWAALQKSTELKLPKLCRHRSIVAVGSITVLLLAIFTGFMVFRSTQSQVASIASAASFAAILGWALSIATAPFAVLPRKDATTLRGLTEAILGLNFKTLSERYGGAHSADVWVALRAIIVEQFDVSPDTVHPTTSFVKDLDCD